MTKEDLKHKKKGSTTYYYSVTFSFSPRFYFLPFNTNVRKRGETLLSMGVFNIRTLNGAARFPNRKMGREILPLKKGKKNEFFKDWLCVRSYNFPCVHCFFVFASLNCLEMMMMLVLN